MQNLYPNEKILNFPFRLKTGEQGLDGAPGLPGPQGENYEVSVYLLTTEIGSIKLLVKVVRFNFSMYSN